MTGSIKILGLQTVLKNIDKMVANYKKTSLAGMYAAGLEVERNAKMGAPHLTGNLRGSGYTRKDPGGAMRVEVGFHAHYAPYVHEMGPRAGGVGRKKFLQRALEEVPVREIIKRYATL